MRLTDLIETFKGHDKVIFKLTGIGETEYGTIEFKDAIDTIEALQQENEQVQELAKAKAEGRLEEVVRCKECIHLETVRIEHAVPDILCGIISKKDLKKLSPIENTKVGICDLGERMTAGCKPNDFCPYGERKAIDGETGRGKEG